MNLRIVAIGLVLGCGPTADRRPGTVMFASGADLQSANPLLTVHPLARQVQRYVLLTTLVRYDSSLTVQPYLARAFEFSPDRRSLTFHLHPTVRWHDGRPTTAKDAVWTLHAAKDPRTGYARLNDLANFESIEALDDSTLRVGFALPMAGVPDVLTDLAILPSHLLDTVDLARLRGAAWNENPVGNGPFRFVEHQPGRRWVFTANPDFPAELGGPPRLDRLVIAVVDEPTTKLAALASGELDFAGIQPAHAEFVNRDSALKVITYPLLFTYGIALNTRRPPFDDPQVRRAIALAIDRQEIVDGYIYGFGTAADGPVVPGVPGYVAPPPVAYSPDSAVAALGSRKLSLELLTVGSGEAALEQMIQAQLGRIGIQVVIRQLELTAFLDRVNSRRPDFQAAVLGTSGDLGLGHLTTLGELAGTTPPQDPALAQRWFADSVPVIFLYHARGLQGANRRVTEVRMDLRGELATVHEWTTSR